MAQHNWYRARIGIGPREAAAAAFPRRRILIVDDNRDTADSEALLLETLGQTVQRAYDAPSAVRIAREFKPDVVLVDLDFPRANAAGPVRELRAIAWMEQARFIAYGAPGSEQYGAAVRAGFEHFIAKPASLSQLIAILREG